MYDEGETVELYIYKKRIRLKAISYEDDIAFLCD